jgi:hypothetical protein
LSDEACRAQLLLLAAHKRFPLHADDCGRPALEAAVAQALDEAEPTCARRPDELAELLNLRGVTSLRDSAGAPDHFDFEAPNCGRRSKTSCRCPRLSWTPGRWPSFAALSRSWLFDSRRMAHFLLKSPRRQVLRPNVRGKLAPTAGRQARAAENVHRTCGSGLVACRWC